MKNIYEQFIEYLKEEEKKLENTNKDIEKHHIFPLHAGGEKNGPIVVCTQKNHTLVHYYRYLAYGEHGDFVAFTMRRSQKIGTQARSLLGIQKMKQNKISFFDPKWQAIQGQKRKKQKKSKKQLVLCQKMGFNNKKIF